VRKSEQPAFIDSTASFTSSRPVTATTSRSGSRRLASRISPRPSRPGITMSVRSRSTRSAASTSSASSAEDEVRTACPAPVSTSRNSSWKKRSSSTTRIRPFAI
jgi:hypothetical protein